MTIVMGLDQHRAQITAEWLDTASGEISRKRIAPAHRDDVRRFAARFRGLELEVALEATTGWRFVVEEIRAVGGRAHLAEPAQTSDLRGSSALELRRSLLMPSFACGVPPVRRTRLVRSFPFPISLS